MAEWCVTDPSLAPCKIFGALRQRRKRDPKRVVGYYMRKLCVLVGATLGSYLGWWLGAAVGVMTAFMLSMLGMGVGMYAGGRAAHYYE